MDVGVLPFSSGAYSNGPLYSATFVSFKLKPELLIRGRRSDSFLSIFLFKKKETFGGKYLEKAFSSQVRAKLAQGFFSKTDFQELQRVKVKEKMKARTI
jgi:hypothetical protein